MTSAQQEITDATVRTTIAALVSSRDIALEVANLMKAPDKQVAPGDWKAISMSLPRFYAVIEAAELAVRLGVSSSLITALASIDDGEEPAFGIANVCARLAWQSQQPLLGEERLARPVMSMTSGNLPHDELKKDEQRMRATAKYLIDKIVRHGTIG